jgi:glycine oxidase
MAWTSLGLYPPFVAELEDATGLDLGLHLDGKLLTAYDREREAELKARMQALEGHADALDWLDGDEVRELEPALSPELRGALLLRGQGRVDNRTLTAALEADCRRRGIEFVQGRVTGLILRRGTVEGVRVGPSRGGALAGDEARIPCSALVLAAGAWSGGIDELPRPLAIRPVKGQMLALTAPEPGLTRVATAGDRYLIPRDTASGPVIVVGATEEDAGFDRTTDDAGQESLHDAAVRLVPGLAGARVAERWAGLRPGTPDGLPVLGPDPDVPDLCYATGHYRNGILLAPYTAARVREWWEGRG